MEYCSAQRLRPRHEAEERRTRRVRCRAHIRPRLNRQQNSQRLGLEVQALETPPLISLSKIQHVREIKAPPRGLMHSRVAAAVPETQGWETPRADPGIPKAPDPARLPADHPVLTVPVMLHLRVAATAQAWLLHLRAATAQACPLHLRAASADGTGRHLLLRGDPLWHGVRSIPFWD